jgi:hypothetical protein
MVSKPFDLDCLVAYLGSIDCIINFIFLLCR